jgi:hypothetical protein
MFNISAILNFQRNKATPFFLRSKNYETEWQIDAGRYSAVRKEFKRRKSRPKTPFILMSAEFRMFNCEDRLYSFRVLIYGKLL